METLSHYLTVYHASLNWKGLRDPLANWRNILCSLEWPPPHDRSPSGLEFKLGDWATSIAPTMCRIIVVVDDNKHLFRVPQNNKNI